MKVIVGLGNPGPRYRNTRHNVGFEVVDRVAQQLGVAFSREKYKALVAKADCSGQPVLLVKPLTFMNNSGISVARVARYRVHDLQSVLVIVDDVNLPLGKLRIRSVGSAGGHRGLQSIIERLGTEAFPRLRMGVGAVATAALVDHVLGRFAPEERPAVDAMVGRAADAAVRFVTEGIAVAMNEFN
ncbi:MAG TPA: aminoacyl-tRNA hydrolase [Candidatus Hydrogenedentes bacterium]|nr:aminoacyl-tRNA hydrolase [Candidatus Hydrogenedentota bacterium]